MKKISKAWPNSTLVENFLNKHTFLIIAILSIPAVWALFVPGFYGASDDLHIAWLQQMDLTLRSGQIPPRFVPDLSYGFGYPLFNFVFPLPFYLGEIFHLVGFSLVASVKAVFLLSFLFSGYFMYKLLKEFTNSVLSLAGAILYIFTPYRSTDVFVRGAIGESLAFIFLPLVILAIVKITRDSKNRKWLGIFALSIAALLMSHNITAYMFLPFAFLFLVVETILARPPRLPILIRSFVGLFLGLVISSYFWIPAVVESNLVKYDTVFNFIDHFPTIRQLVTSHFGYGASVPGPYDGMSFFIGTVNLMLLIAGSIAFFASFKKFKSERKILFYWLVIVVMISIFMMNHRSTFVWDSIPLIAYFQFPWRFLTLVTFTSPIFVIFLDRFRFSSYLGIVIILAAIGLNLSYFRPHDFLGRTDEYYLNRYIPTPIASEEYKRISEEYLRLPLATQTRPDRNYPRITVSNGEILNADYPNGLDARFETNSDQDIVVSYNKYFFPGWQVRIDDHKITPQPGKPFGQIFFSVPSGRHLVKIYFRETVFRGVFDAISLLGFVVAVKMVLGAKKKP